MFVKNTSQSQAMLSLQRQGLTQTIVHVSITVNRSSDHHHASQTSALTEGIALHKSRML